MTDGNSASPPEEAPLFAVVLTPYRSLSPAGFMLVMMVLVACSFTAGLAFWLMGAWPVVGFFGLDIALVQLAFRLNYRAARVAEEISLTRDRLTVRKIAANGQSVEIGFNPYWARLEVDHQPEIGLIRLWIASHGRRLAIGGFLPLPERASFAAAFAAALAEARGAAAA
jgi:uncharacterized membrane protein